MNTPILLALAVGCTAPDPLPGTGPSDEPFRSACGDFAQWDRTGQVLSWTYADGNPFLSVGATSEWTQEALGEAERGGAETLLVRTEGFHTEENVTTTYQRDYHYVCTEEGVGYAGQDYTFSTGEQGGAISADYPTIPLVLPATLAPGDSWTIDAPGTANYDGIEVDNPLGPETYVVGELLQIEIPAGSFAALPVERTKDTGEVTTGYLVEGVGWVWWEETSWLTAISSPQ